jgi:hypothetical protein
MSRAGSALGGTEGERVELVRYVVCGVERVLHSLLIDGVVHITDAPADGAGRAYHVDCCLERDGYASVQALAADYTRQAARLEVIPMVATVLRRIEQVELGRYRFTGGQRVLYGQRVNGVVRVTDRPAEGSAAGRSYLVEMGLECDGYTGLRTLVEEYTRQAGALDEIPMAARTARAARRAREREVVELEREVV